MLPWAPAVLAGTVSEKKTDLRRFLFYISLPYSIAILLEENQKKFGRQPVEIIATDISQAALARARAGEYTQFEVGRGMPQQYLSRYFTRGERNHYLIAPTIKKRVTFQPRNLLEPFDRLGQFDIIFCRNVLIYFDRPTKSNVLERMARLMPQDGYLILGGPETTLGLTPQFARHGDLRNVYVRASAEAAQARNVA